MRMATEKSFPMIGKKVSNGWKKIFQWLENFVDFYNDWKKSFQWLEKLALAGCVAWGTVAWGQEAADAPEVAEAGGGEQAVKRLAVGRAALEDGIGGLARRQFQSVLAESQDRRRQAEAALWLARVALAEGKPQEAVRLLAGHRNKIGMSGPLAAGYALESARADAASGKPDAALEELEGFASKYPGDAAVPAALRLAMESAAELGNWEAAEAAGTALEGLPAGDGQDGEQAPGAWMSLADRMAGADQTDKARAVLTHVAEKWPDPSPWHGWAVVRLAELDLEGGKLAGKAWLERLEKLDPASEAASGGYRVAARALAAEGEYGAALEAAEKALSLARHPEDRLECQVLRARLMGAAGRGEEGAELLREVAGRVPDESLAASLQMQLADWLEQAGRPEEAEAECRAWLEAFEGAEGTAGIHARLGRLLAAQGRKEEAEGGGGGCDGTRGRG